ncbi:uncharacterized protein Bfra_000700 [Botrytis fragariae]|uniref:Uncharacterized protein n=1 Tax=Botrytis fragariae TaxID=1964551 RepID=A0A8H6B3K6_9HELO|nr:uncharacterized protein Bfra_000700 [Botrytis fragariae]KAF5878533.1 hypothetical protein Bfra_000700 [Botrytis fragariae]
MNNPSTKLLVEFKPESSKRTPSTSQHKAIEIIHSSDPYQQWINLRTSLLLHLNSLTDGDSVSITKVHVLWNVLHSYVEKQDLNWSSIYEKADEILETQESVDGTPEPEVKRNEERCMDVVIALGLLRVRDNWDRLCVEYRVEDDGGKRQLLKEVRG